MIEPFLDILAEASASVPGSTGTRFAVADSAFGVYASDNLLRQLMAALEHHPVPPGEEDDLTILAWEGDPSPLLRAPIEWRVEERWANREPVWASDENGMVFFDPIGGLATLYDFKRGLGGIWFRDAGSIPLWIEAAPFLRLLDAWFVRRGKLLCHGAAIARNGVAAFIVGPGGAGKSTLAIQSTGRAFGYIGDDYVLLDPGHTHPIVHNLYNSAKLEAADLAASITDRYVIHRKPDAGTEKFFLRIDPSIIVASAPVAVVIAPCIGRLEFPRVEEISAGDALRAILPSALRQLPGEHQLKLDILTRILKVPCLRLHLASSTAHNLGSVDEELAARAQGMAV